MPTCLDDIAIDIELGLEAIKAGQRLDPALLGDRCWACVVVDVVSGKQISAGVGLSAPEARADAWVASWPLATLIDAILGRIAPPMPDGRWRFECAEPGCWERVRHTVAARNAPRATGRG